MKNVQRSKNHINPWKQYVRDRILELVDIDLSKKWPTTEPTVEHRIYLELVESKRRDLSLRLPFNKKRPADLYECQWLSHLAATMRKTLKSEKWFHNAHLLDLERGTRLGTLGYFPPEIRALIWKEVAKLAGTEWLKATTKLLEDCHRHGSLPARDGLVCNIQEALGHSAYEFDAAFFPNVDLVFASPGCLKRFSKLFATASNPYLHLTVDILTNKCRECSSWYWRRCLFDHTDEEWVAAFNTLLPSVKSLQFRLGRRVVTYLRSNPLKPLLEDFRRLNEAVAKRCPEAERSMQLKSGWYSLPRCDEEAFEAVLRDPTIDWTSFIGLPPGSF